jgi:hypothetical protein
MTSAAPRMPEAMPRRGKTSRVRSSPTLRAPVFASLVVVGLRPVDAALPSTAGVRTVTDTTYAAAAGVACGLWHAWMRAAWPPLDTTYRDTTPRAVRARRTGCSAANPAGVD